MTVPDVAADPPVRQPYFVTGAKILLLDLAPTISPVAFPRASTCPPDDGFDFTATDGKLGQPKSEGVGLWRLINLATSVPFFADLPNI